MSIIGRIRSKNKRQAGSRKGLSAARSKRGTSASERMKKAWKTRKSVYGSSGSRLKKKVTVKQRVKRTISKAVKGDKSRMPYKSIKSSAKLGSSNAR